MTSKGIIFRFITYVVIILLLFTILGYMLGLDSTKFSLSSLLEGFANSPTSELLNNFSDTLNDFKTTISDLTIDTQDITNKSLLVVIGAVNSVSRGFFGMISLTITMFQMLGSVITFAYYCWSTFLV